MTRWAWAPAGDEAPAIMLAAGLFAIAFPPFPPIGAVFLCLVPFAVAIARRADGAGTRRSAGRIGLWFGALGYACNLYWIAIALSVYTKLAILGYVAALFVVAPITAAVGAALFVARRATHLPMAVLLPVVWVASEVLFNYLGDLAFPWLPLGLATATGHPVLAQIADVSGVRGISFWIAASNGLLADAYMLRARRRAAWMRIAAALSLGAAVACYGVWRERTTALRAVAPIAVVQPNIPQDDAWLAQNEASIVGTLASLTRRATATGGAALVLWPEAALPGFLFDHPAWRDSLHALAIERRTPLIIGLLDVDFRTPTDYLYYNAAVLVDPAGTVGAQPAYRKSYLVPIVERVPFVNPEWFKSLQYFGGYARGRNVTPFVLPFARVSVLICYESIFPQRSRLYRRGGADLFVNITNDAWFGRTLAPYQHAAHVVLRAIENRVGIVRAANSGISGYVDPLGRMHAPTGLFTRETRTYVAQTTDVRTLYVIVGDWIGTSCVAATLALLAAHAVRARLSGARSRGVA